MKDLFDLVERYWSNIKDNFAIWWQVVVNPLKTIRSKSYERRFSFEESAAFLFFVTVATVFIMIPVDAIALEANLGDPIIILSLTILYLLVPIFFGIIVHFVAHLFLVGKIVPLASSMSTFFYLSAFLPFVYLPQYYSRANTSVLQAIRELNAYIEHGDPAIRNTVHAGIFIPFMVEVIFITFVAYKSIPVIAWLYRFSYIKATAVFVTGGFLHSVLMGVVLTPFTRRIFPAYA